MKKLLILTWLMIVSLVPAHVMAGNAAEATILGAMGGAALGQAIGRDTEATLVGAALGSVFGYMIGNDSGRHVYATGQVVVPVYPQRAYPDYRRDYIDRRWGVQDHYRPFVRPTTVIVNKTVIIRPPVRHVAWGKRHQHQSRWEKRNHRHHDKHRHLAKLNRHDHDRRAERGRSNRHERRERW
jgi:hypothetical protein